MRLNRETTIARNALVAYPCETGSKEHVCESQSNRFVCLLSAVPMTLCFGRITLLLRRFKRCDFVFLQ